MVNKSPMADLPPSALLQARLDKLEWTQVEFAKVLGVSTGVVSRWLSGKRKPSLQMAFRIERSKIGIPAKAWVTYADVDADESGPHQALPAAAYRRSTG